MVKKYNIRISETLFTDITLDEKDVHPSNFCHKCYTKMVHIEQRKTSKVHSVPIWSPHSGTSCNTCAATSNVKPGKKKKKKSTGMGRPKSGVNIWSRKLIDQIIPKEKLSAEIPRDIPIDKIANLSEASLCRCCNCNYIASQPLMITVCQHLFCYKCFVPYIIGKEEINGVCSTCNVQIPMDGIIIPTHINHLISLLTIHCYKCNKGFSLLDFNALNEHEKNCIPPPSPSLLKDVFKMDEKTGVSRLAEEACLHILKTKMKQDNQLTQSCKLISGGPRPTVVSITPVACKPSNQVCTKTLRKRTLDLKNNLEMVAGSSKESTTLQTGLLLKSFDVEERQSILEISKIEKSYISADNLVAMKADLGMPWEKMKAMSRWLKKFSVTTASNAKQRVVAKQWHGDSFKVEDAPFTFPVKDRRNQFKICSAPLAYVENFPSHVLNLLDLLDENGQLFFNDINEAVQVKIGGDHGGNSFKMSFQIANVKNPNSKENTIVFCMFEAKDYRSNLEVALNMFREQIDHLQSLLWKNRRIEIFMFGDYQFQCIVYGITGANGRHCCLYCVATKEQIQSNSTIVEMRTLESIKTNFESFVSGGSVLKNAKNYFNCIYMPMFKIPLSQLCPPGLHIDLGTYLKFFNMFEEACQGVDDKIAVIAGNRHCVFSNVRKEIKNLYTSIEDKELKLDLVRDAIANAILANPDDEVVIKDTYEPRLIYLAEKISEKLEQIESLKASDSYREPGPCEKELDEVLKSLTVQRQAYHGKSFIGNHVHKMLQEESIQKLCRSINLIVNERTSDPEILDYADSISRKFEQLFTLYSSCSKLFNSCMYFQDSDLIDLEKCIIELFVYLRGVWPTESITPKLHMLESHVVPFIRMWRYGIGKYGEQGGEGIHSEFNNLSRVYCRIRSNTQRVESMLKEHGIRTHPLARKLKPQIKKRKKQ